MAKLSAFIRSADTFQIVVSKDYDLESFRMDLKSLLIKSGGSKANKTMFLLHET